MQLRLALPKGQLLPQTSALLQRCGLDIAGYDDQSRSYRPECRNLPGVFLKVFNEKDIPIQVAVGNYDLGICGQDWVAELLARYPSSGLVKIQDLGYGHRRLCLAASEAGWLEGQAGTIRIATEYPNLAQAFALQRRFRRFAVFPLWGGAEAYPPESADLALIARSAGAPVNHGLVQVADMLDGGACLVAHRPSWESRDLSPILDRLCASAPEPPPARGPETPLAAAGQAARQTDRDPDAIWMALPDGHQIRPQDMPLQVANGNFDLAITGEDWLADHLYQFPSSPVRKLLALPFGRVRIVAVVSKTTPFEGPRDLQAPLRRQEIPALRIASEYINIADRYARENHLSPCRLIPTWGATEAFLPEDADLLIENTQTGRTLAQHGLRIIDTLFESSACLIGRTPPSSSSSFCPADRDPSGIRDQRAAAIVRRLERALEESQ